MIFTIKDFLRTSPQYPPHVCQQVSEEGNIDAKRLDSERNNNPGKWSSTKGRVPMFYVDDMTLPNNGKQPWYFNIADLKAEYKKQQQERGNNDVVLSNDKIQLVEMMNLFRTASRTNDWSMFSNVVLVPVRESKQVAIKIVKNATPGSSPYNFDKAFLVSSSKWVQGNFFSFPFWICVQVEKGDGRLQYCYSVYFHCIWKRKFKKVSYVNAAWHLWYIEGSSGRIYPLDVNDFEWGMSTWLHPFPSATGFVGTAGVEPLAKKGFHESQKYISQSIR
jgi:hypothetical protein